MTDLQKLVEQWWLQASMGLPPQMNITVARERFARLAMQYAAEEAAKVCEKTDADGEHHEWYGWGAADYAQAIRERFKTL